MRCLGPPRQDILPVLPSASCSYSCGLHRSGPFQAFAVCSAFRSLFSSAAVLAGKLGITAPLSAPSFCHPRGLFSIWLYHLVVVAVVVQVQWVDPSTVSNRTLPPTSGGLPGRTRVGGRALVVLACHPHPTDIFRFVFIVVAAWIMRHFLRVSISCFLHLRC